MKKFQYQVVRYRHDRVTGEFVNVGIIVYEPASGFVDSQFISKYSRITQFFENVDGNYLIKILKQFKKEFEYHSVSYKGLFSNTYKSINDISGMILPKDDSSLFCSEVFTAIDLDLKIAMSDLFERIVDRYINETDKMVKDDKYVWKNIYKKYFDAYSITDKLTSHIVKTANDRIEFDKTWKNGVWNCFETVSFDLKKDEAIKNKIYRWSGVLNELENANEELHLYFLTALPSNKDTQLTKFIKETFNDEKYKSIKVELITEKDAEKLTKKFKEKIENHED
ncbi:DUF3037 domain-containing protein [Elizabethkingia anophelis]|uniref:DUF3037 domain-containing protein n=1 Tax=Elizabethkingia anophelis TaxID=1117645 RepID=UPI001E12175C|nr:DUF3037 domain-containing protein [Elizabethkingia anophelis]EHM7982831.1 DUF3037 domain-containing protein [Elizabethkingia anophelis]EHM8030162.1 DUF3037 domain-containing protein [Elizabethkingia anophelis]EHM8034166.1 DUF3037 domain-containing protein [Elizabethkingia anophelis]EHZ9532916.1 DUF3037 domain-containing protein [Elizabethkingia anophelis]EKU3670826.1 DUF3037 domain-containing protein [Elizabethkingia anophelis]